MEIGNEIIEAGVPNMISLSRIDAEEFEYLQRIHNIYQDILTKRNLEYFLSKEMEVDQLFSSICTLERSTPSFPERDLLLKELQNMILRITEFVKLEKDKLEGQEKLVVRYSSSNESIFFDRKA